MFQDVWGISKQTPLPCTQDAMSPWGLPSASLTRIQICTRKKQPTPIWATTAASHNGPNYQPPFLWIYEHSQDRLSLFYWWVEMLLFGFKMAAKKFPGLTDVWVCEAGACVHRLLQYALAWLVDQLLMAICTDNNSLYWDKMSDCVPLWLKTFTHCRVWSHAESGGSFFCRWWLA